MVRLVVKMKIQLMQQVRRYTALQRDIYAFIAASLRMIPKSMIRNRGCTAGVESESHILDISGAVALQSNLESIDNRCGRFLN